MSSKKPFKKQFRPGFQYKVAQEDNIVSDEIRDKLFSSLQDGNITKVLQFISRNNTAINFINDEGQNLLHIIIQNNFANMGQKELAKLVNFLIGKGVSPITKDKSGNTPLHYAVKKQNPYLVKLLLAYASGVKLYNNQGMNPLHFSVQGEFKPCTIPKRSIPFYKSKKSDSKLSLSSDHVLWLKETFAEDKYARYITAMTNILKAPNETFPEGFDREVSSLLDKIGTILSDTNSTDEAKKNKINSELKTSIQNSTKLFLDDGLNDTIANMEIKNEFTSGFPETDPIIQESLDDFIARKRNELIVEENNLPTKYDEKGISSGKEIDDLLNNFLDAEEKLNDVVYLNFYLENDNYLVGLLRLIKSQIGRGTPAMDYSTLIAGKTLAEIIRNTAEKIGLAKPTIGNDRELRTALDTIIDSPEAKAGIPDLKSKIQLDTEKDIKPVYIDKPNNPIDFTTVTNSGKLNAVPEDLTVEERNIYFLTKGEYINNRKSDKVEQIPLKHYFTGDPFNQLYEFSETGRLNFPRAKNLEILRRANPNNIDLSGVRINNDSEFEKFYETSPGAHEKTIFTNAKFYMALMFNNYVRFERLIVDIYNTNKIHELNNKSYYLDQLIYLAIMESVNFCQNLSEFKKKMPELEKNINELKAFINDHTFEPYFSQFRVITFNMDQILFKLQRDFKAINEKINNLYSAFLETYNHLNILINHINKKSFFRLIETNIATEFDQEEFTMTKPYFSGKLPLVGELPRTFDEYFEKYQILFNKDMREEDGMVKYIFEKMVPVIDKTNKTGFYYTAREETLKVDLPKYNGTVGSIELNAKRNLEQGKVGFIGNRSIDTTPATDRFKTFRTTDGKEFSKVTLKPTIKNPQEIKNDERNIIFVEQDESKFGLIRLLPSGPIKKTQRLPIIEQNMDQYMNILKRVIFEQLVTNFFGATGTDKAMKIRSEQLKIIEEATTIAMNNDKFYKVLFGKLVDKLMIKLVSDLSKKAVKRVYNSKVAEIDPSLSRLEDGDTRFDNIFMIGDEELTRNIKVYFNDFIEQIKKEIGIGNIKTKTSIEYVAELSRLPAQMNKPEEGSILVYDKDYNLDRYKEDQMCFKINPVILDMLIKYGIRKNKQDINGLVPLHYAIEYQHVDTIKKLIEFNTTIHAKEVRSKGGFTPLEHQFQLLRFHNQYVHNDKEIFERPFDQLYSNFEEDINKLLDLKPTTKHNRMRGIEIMFPWLFMYTNEIFYDRINQFRTLLNPEDENKMLQLFKKYLFNNDQSKLEEKYRHWLDLQDGNTEEEIKENLKKVVSAHSGNNYLLMADDLIEKIKKITQQKSQIDKIKGNYSGRTGDEFEIMRAERAKDIKNQSDELQRLLDAHNKTEVTQTKEKLNEMIENKVREIYTKYTTGSDFKLQLKNSVEDNHRLLENLFNGKTYDQEYKDLTGQEEFNPIMLYVDQNMRDFDKISSVKNIHIIMSQVIDAILDKVEAKKIDGMTKEEIKELSEDIDLMKKIYEEALTKPMKDIYELGNYYDEVENYALFEQLETIRYVMSRTMVASFYNSILMTIASYFNTVTNISTYSGFSDDFRSSLTGLDKLQIVNIIVKSFMNNKIGSASDPDPDLLRFMLGQMSEDIIKFTFKVYETDMDEAGMIASLDDIFKPIIDILMTNSKVLIPEDSELIRIVRDELFPFWKNMFELVVPQMKAVLDNYNRLIINEHRHLEITHLLLSEYAKDL